MSEGAEEAVNAGAKTHAHDNAYGEKPKTAK